MSDAQTATNRSIEFLGQTNITNEGETYQRFQDLESPPFDEIIDKEAILDKFEERMEELKENVENLEEPLPSDNITRFEMRDLLESNSAVELNSTQPVEQFSNSTISTSLNQTSTEQLQSMTMASDITSSSISKHWKGLNINTASRGSGAVPPDVTLATGPDHVVQMVHSAIRIWDKTGQEIESIFLDDFFRPDSSHVLSDPVVLYDQQTSRWFSAIMEISPVAEVDDPCYYDCSILVAVSSNSDPTSNWNIFRVPFGKDLPDYPMIAVNNKYFAFGINVFGINDYIGTQAVLIDKNKLIENTAPIPTFFSTPNPDYYTIYPVSSNTDCMYMEANDWAPRFFPSFVTEVILYTVCGDLSTNNININDKPIHIGYSVLPVDANQPNNIRGDTDFLKIRGPVYFNNTIISAFNYSCENPEGVRESCIRLLKIELTEGNSTVTVKGLSANDADIFYPSISLNKGGKLVMVFGTSSEEIYPSLAIATFDKDLNNIKIVPLVNGNANTNSHGERQPRFGDYFASATDPIDGSVWVSGEYGDRDLPSRWSTYVGNIH